MQSEIIHTTVDLSLGTTGDNNSYEVVKKWTKYRKFSWAVTTHMHTMCSINGRLVINGKKVLLIFKSIVEMRLKKTKHVQFNKPAYFTWTWLLCHLRCGEQLHEPRCSKCRIKLFVGGLLIHRTLFHNFQKYTSFNQWLYKATQNERLVSYLSSTHICEQHPRIISPTPFARQLLEQLCHPLDNFWPIKQEKRINNSIWCAHSQSGVCFHFKSVLV